MTEILPSTRRRRAGIALLSIGFWVWGAAGRASETRTTPLPEEMFPELKGILQAALQQSPQMILKNIELAQSEAARMTAVAQMLPSVGTSVSYNVSDAAVSSNTDVTSRSSGIFYSATLNQPVYRWGTLQAQAEAAKIQLNITRRNFAEAYRQLALSIRNQYLGLVYKKIALRNAEAARERAAYSLSLEEAKLQYGRISQSEIIAPRLEMEEARLRADKAAEDLAAAKRSFSRLTGLPEPADDSIPDKIPQVSYDPAATTALARAFLGERWESSPAIQSARDWVRVAELNYKVAKYRLYPMFSFGASISQTNSTTASENSVSQVGVLSQYLGVTATWTIFDGRATKAAQTSARANQRYYERQLQNQTDALIDQVRAMEKQLGFSHRALQLAEIRQAQAESAVRQRQDELQQGLSSQVTLDAALATQDSYTLNLLSQRLDFLSRWSEFVSTTDTDPVLQFLPATLKSNVH